jgi:hypothetical protein
LDVGFVVVHDDGNDVVVVVAARLLQVVGSDILPNQRIINVVMWVVSIPAHIAEQNHVNRQNRQLLNSGVVNCLVGNVHTCLEDRKRRLGANGVSSYFEVLLDGPNMFVGAVCCLLYNRLRVSGKVLDKAFL